MIPDYYWNLVLIVVILAIVLAFLSWLNRGIERSTPRRDP
jgi:hypothetical protein